MTSTEVKDRWNAKNYDQVQLRVPKGAREQIQAVAAERGMSVAAYIKHLIVQDTADKPESTSILRGGGLIDYWKSVRN